MCCLLLLLLLLLLTHDCADGFVAGPMCVCRQGTS
jgi:hypothetical protein